MRLFIKIATTPKSQRKTESHNLIGCQTFGENASKIIGPPPSFSLLAPPWLSTYQRQHNIRGDAVLCVRNVCEYVCLCDTWGTKFTTKKRVWEHKQVLDISSPGSQDYVASSQHLKDKVPTIQYLREYRNDSSPTSKHLVIVGRKNSLTTGRAPQ